VGLAAVVFAGACLDVGAAGRASPTPAGQSAPPESRLNAAPGVPGDPEHGRLLFTTTGCAGCHTVSGLPAASGVIGPNLTNVVLRGTLADTAVQTTPATLLRWLLDPASVKPGTTMPSVGLSEDEARDIAAFLYSQPRNSVR
jgi:cytochrome c1